MSQWIGGLIPIIYFIKPNNSLLHIVKCKLDGKSMIKICVNGSSELVNNISMAIVSLLYNMQLIKYAGDNGIAAYGVLMYVNFLFTAIFWGYVVAVSPIISYHYGAKNKSELRSLLRKSLVIVFASSFIMFVVSESLSKPISNIFVGYDPELLQMTVKGFFLFSFCFLFAGLAIFGSAFFTALNNGLISAIISFSRVFVFQIPAILILPLMFEINGIWLSLVFADFLTSLLGVLFIIFKRKKYGY